MWHNSIFLLIKQFNQTINIITEGARGIRPISRKSRDSVACNGIDVAVAADLANAIVVGIGNVEVVRPVNKDRVRSVQLGTGSRSRIAGKSSAQGELTGNR